MEGIQEVNQTTTQASATSTPIATVITGPVDITSFDAIANCEDGFEFELKGIDGITGTGVFVTVQGKHSDEVTAWQSELFRKMQIEAQMAQKRGKEIKTKTVEELRQQNIEGASIRVIGWRNVKQPFTRDLLKVALKRNPHWIEQIVEESDNLGNFIKAQPTA